MHPHIKKFIARARQAWAVDELQDALDSHAYTQDGNHQALEGLGWKPATLADDELSAIADAIDEIDNELWAIADEPVMDRIAGDPFEFGAPSAKLFPSRRQS